MRPYQTKGTEESEQKTPDKVQYARGIESCSLNAARKGLKKSKESVVQLVCRIKPPKCFDNASFVSGYRLESWCCVLGLQ